MRRAFGQKNLTAGRSALTLRALLNDHLEAAEMFHVPLISEPHVGIVGS